MNQWPDRWVGGVAGGEVGWEEEEVMLARGGCCSGKYW